jgi:GAF domain-containing protein
MHHDDHPGAAQAPVPVSSELLLGWIRDVAAELGRASGGEQVVKAVVGQGEVVGVMGALVALLHDQRLFIRDHVGYDDELMRRFGIMPLAASLPLTDATRLGVPVYLGDPAAISAAYPPLLGVHPRIRAMAAIPLERGGTTIGVLGLAFDHDIEFTAPARAAVEAVAGLCSGALRPASNRVVGAVDAQPVSGQADDSLADRVADLERDVAALRELLGFLGGVAANRLG